MENELTVSAPYHQKGSYEWEWSEKWLRVRGGNNTQKHNKGWFCVLDSLSVESQGMQHGQKSLLTMQAVTPSSVTDSARSPLQSKGKVHLVQNTGLGI